MKKTSANSGKLKLVLAMVLCAILLLTIVACNDVDNDDNPPASTITPTPEPIKPGTGNGNTGTGNNGGNSGGNNGNTGIGGNNGGNTEPKIDFDFSSANTDLSSYTINIPSNAAFLGITTVGGNSEASSSAVATENPDIQHYLTAFDEYKNIIDGEGGTITFSQIKNALLKHKIVPVYEEVEREELVWEKELDENGNKVPVIDEETGEQKTEIVIHKIVVGTKEATVDVAVLKDGTVVYIIIEEDLDGSKKMFLATEDGDYVRDGKGDAVVFNFDETTMYLDYRYVYEKDDFGAYVRLTDEDGNYIFADETTDPREKTVEVIVERDQQDFALDILKLKVVGDYAFVTFSLPIPDYCYDGGTWRIKLPDGGVKVVNSWDLPKRYEDCTEKEKELYNTTNFTTDLFQQSYAINTMTKKIYSLAGLDIAEINDEGFFSLSGSDRKYSIVLDNNVLLFNAVDVTTYFNSETTNYIKKDNNGIIYVEDSGETDVVVQYKPYPTNESGVVARAYTIIFPQSITTIKIGVGKYTINLIPEFVFDNCGNAYSFKDGGMRKVLGVNPIDVDGNGELNDADIYTIIYSEEDYSDTDVELELQLDGRRTGTSRSYVLKGMLYNVNNDIDDGNYMVWGMHTTFARSVKTIDDGEVMMGTPRLYTPDADEDEFGFYYMAYSPRSGMRVNDEGHLLSYVYDGGTLIIDSENIKDGDIRILMMKFMDNIHADEEEYFVPTAGVFTPVADIQFSDYTYYADLKLTCNGEALDVGSIKKISVKEEDNYIYLEMTVRYSAGAGFSQKILYASIDMLDPSLEVVCYENSSEGFRKREIGNSDIITISPIN